MKEIPHVFSSTSGRTWPTTTASAVPVSVVSTRSFPADFLALRAFAAPVVKFAAFCCVLGVSLLVSLLLSICG